MDCTDIHRLVFGVSFVAFIFQGIINNLRDCPMSKLFQTFYWQVYVLYGRLQRKYLQSIVVIQRILNKTQFGEVQIFRRKRQIFRTHNPKKVHTIFNVPFPTSISELKSYLDLLNLYGRFIPKLSTMLKPLACDDENRCGSFAFDRRRRTASDVCVKRRKTIHNFSVRPQP